MRLAKQLKLENFLFQTRGWKRWSKKRLKEYENIKQLLS